MLIANSSQLFFHRPFFDLHVSNDHGVFLILFEKIFPPTPLLEPPSLVIPEKSAPNTVFNVMDMKKSQLHALI